MLFKIKNEHKAGSTCWPHIFHEVPGLIFCSPIFSSTSRAKSPGTEPEVAPDNNLNVGSQTNNKQKCESGKHPLKITKCTYLLPIGKKDLMNFKIIADGKSSVGFEEVI